MPRSEQEIQDLYRVSEALDSAIGGEGTISISEIVELLVQEIIRCDEEMDYEFAFRYHFKLPHSTGRVWHQVVVVSMPAQGPYGEWAEECFLKDNPDAEIVGSEFIGYQCIAFS